MERFSHFIHLTGEELAGDESFQSYVFRKNRDDVMFWESFIALHPEKQNEIDGAAEILHMLAFRRASTPAHEKEIELTRLLSSIPAFETQNAVADLEENSEAIASSPVRRLFTSQWSRVAASMTGVLVLLSAAFFVVEGFFRQETLKYETQYGENMTIRLPDSSVVILNGNTRLTLHEGWHNNVREVWLDGEAFFEVKHRGSSPNARFTVHTPGMDVEVLGTRFNVFNRDDKVNVVLNSGKVELKISSATDTSSLVMNPDESVEFLRKDHSIIKKQVNAELLTSWRNKVLVFENTPLYQIGEIIENTYGMEVIFDRSVDKNEALAGTIPTENLDVLLTVLAKSSRLNITRRKHQIVITKTDPVSAQP